MNIVVIGYIDFPEYGAAHAYTLEMCKELARQVRKLTLLIGFSQGTTKSRLNQTVNNVFYQGFYLRKMAGELGDRAWSKFTTRILSSVNIIRYLCKANKKDKIDWVFVINEMTFFEGLPIILLCKALGIKFAIHIFDLRFEEFRDLVDLNLKKRLFGMNAKLARNYLFPLLADIIFPISQYLSDYYRGLKHLKSRVEILSVFVDIDKFTPKRKADVFRKKYGIREKRIITYCGTYLRNQGVHVLLDAISILSKKADLPFVTCLTGAWPFVEYEEIKKLIDRYAIQEHLLLTGNLPETSIPSLLASSDIFVLPRTEHIQNVASFPSKLAQYLASGRPVVCSRIGEVLRYCRDGVDLLYFDVDSAENLAEILERLIRNEDLRKRIGINGRKTAEEKFDVKKVIGRLQKRLQKEIMK